jgi:hypothetical protein
MRKVDDSRHSGPSKCLRARGALLACGCCLAALVLAAPFPVRVPQSATLPRGPSRLASAEEKPEAPAPSEAGKAPGKDAEKVQNVAKLSWEPLFKGVDHARAEASTPRRLKIHVIRVDLADPDIRFLVTPPNGEKPEETDGERTSTFLKKHGLQLAVNASPYKPVGSIDGEPRDVLGLSISRGDKYSTEAAGYGALIITKDNKARIEVPPLDSSNAYNAVGGFRLLIKDGKNVGQKDALHPRTAVGISRDGLQLYFLVIDGRQPGYSEGTTTEETAEWLLGLGAYQGLNLDGGGSTSLVISDGKGGARSLNRPIHAGIPGLERVNGNNLGLFAKPVPPPTK